MRAVVDSNETIADKAVQLITIFYHNRQALVVLSNITSLEIYMQIACLWVTLVLAV